MNCAACRHSILPIRTSVFSKLHVAAGVTWLLKRAHLAKKMELVFPSSGAGQQAIARAVLQTPRDFCKLTGLEIQAKTTDCQEDEKHVTMAVDWLGQASKLKYLTLQSMACRICLAC